MNEKIMDLLKDVGVGEVVNSEEHGVHFMKMSIDSDGKSVEFYAYSGKGTHFTIDLKTAKSLANTFNISTVSVVDSSHLENRGAVTRWAYLMTMEKDGKKAIQIGSAGADEIKSWRFKTKAPDMAFKRAYIRCVLEILNIDNISTEAFEYAFEDDKEDPGAQKSQNGDKGTRSNHKAPLEKGKTVVTSTQMNMIKQLWDERGISEDKRKIPQSKEEAEEIIGSLKIPKH